MKIAYIGGKGLPSKTGTERVIEAITTRLSGKHEITVYCDPEYTPAGTHIDGINLIRLPIIQGKHARATSLYLFSALHALFKGDYDLIHVHGTETCFTLPILRLRYKVIATEHGITSRGRLEKWSWLARFIMMKMEYPYLYLSNVATTISSVDQKFIFDKYKKHVIFTPNGVDTKKDIDVHGARAVLEKMGVTPGNFLLFVARRIDPLKGCHLILEALDQLGVDTPLVVIGDLCQVPEYGEKLRRMAANRPVYFLPPIDEKPILFGFMQLSKQFLFPSFSEGMSMVLLEVASLGVPIICSDIPENQAVLQENGIYFRAGDAKDLAEKLAWSMKHAEDINRLADCAKEMLLQKHSWDIIAQEYDELYQRCSSGKPAAIGIYPARNFGAYGNEPSRSNQSNPQE